MCEVREYYSIIILQHNNGPLSRFELNNTSSDYVTTIMNKTKAITIYLKRNGYCITFHWKTTSTASHTS